VPCSGPQSNHMGILLGWLIITNDSVVYTRPDISFLKMIKLTAVFEIPDLRTNGCQCNVCLCA